MKTLFGCLLLGVLLSACGANNMTETIKVLGANGEVVSETIKTAFDQSTQKEKLYTDNIKDLIEAKRSDAALPLAVMETEEVTKTVRVTGTVCGQPADLNVSYQETVLKKASLRLPMNFEYNVPWRPSVHPGWETVYKLAKLGLIGFGIDKFTDYLTGISSKDTYSIGAGATINSPLSMEGGSTWTSNYTLTQEGLTESSSTSLLE